MKRITGGCQMEIRFLELKQGDRSVAKYEAKFTELARLVPDYVRSEAQKARRFQQGLKPEIHSGIVVLQLKTYPSIVQDALVIEIDQKLVVREKEDKKRKIDDMEGIRVKDLKGKVFLQIGLVTPQSVLTKLSRTGMDKKDTMRQNVRWKTQESPVITVVRLTQSRLRQLKVKSKVILKTLFRTGWEHCEFRVMLFGLANAPVAFKGLMNIMYKKYFDSVILFIDNILSHSGIKEGQVEHLKRCLRRVEK
ncbi:uncharacterized protein LOC141685234 [Apium graveolens]|uniref:uncharacterized protein LOC141685234 n=1 Tax=Apium graveolens TaxID=4045 RepID=UPI003D799038